MLRHDLIYGINEHRVCESLQSVRVVSHKKGKAATAGRAVLAEASRRSTDCNICHQRYPQTIPRNQRQIKSALKPFNLLLRCRGRGASRLARQGEEGVVHTRHRSEANAPIVLLPPEHIER